MHPQHEHTSPSRREPRAAPTPFPERAWFVPLADAKIDERGHDPRSDYVELFWLGILGPSPTWLVRRVVMRFAQDPNGFEVDCAEMAAELGLAAGKGWASTFGRAIQRCVMFGIAAPLEHGVVGWSFRRRLPTVAARHVARLPERIAAMHADWYQRELVTSDVASAAASAGGGVSSSAGR
ncbi:MAG: hypothetical protein M3Q72_03630 [Actinomycetota bacterium]|nr:hypothetical protein [Actinomycetota bacterium]